MKPSVVMGDFLDHHAARVQDYLDEREAPPEVMNVCAVCKQDINTQPREFRSLFRCQDCPFGSTMCYTCIRQDHAVRPFDRLRRWSVEDECWERVTTAELGHVVYLGHGGHCCPEVGKDRAGNPDPRSRMRIITVLHEHGLVDMPFVFCRCTLPVNDAQQLLGVGLWPATWDTPKTVITLHTLDSLHYLSLQAQVNYHDYFEHLKRMTDGVLTDDVTVRADLGFAVGTRTQPGQDRNRELNHAMRQYSFIRLCRRCGVSAGRNLPPRTVTVQCPACPHPERNIRKNFFERAKEKMYVTWMEE